MPSIKFNIEPAENGFIVSEAPKESWLQGRRWVSESFLAAVDIVTSEARISLKKQQNESLRNTSDDPS